MERKEVQQISVLVCFISRGPERRPVPIAALLNRDQLKYTPSSREPVCWLSSDPHLPDLRYK